MTEKQYFEIVKTASRKRKESSKLIDKSHLLMEASSRILPTNQLWRVYHKFANELLDKSKVLHEEVRNLLKILTEEDNKEVIELLNTELEETK